MIAFAQADEEVVGSGFLGLNAGSCLGQNKEYRIWMTAKLMAQNAERGGGVSELLSRLRRGQALDEIGAQGLVHALFSGTGFQKETSYLR